MLWIRLFSDYPQNKKTRRLVRRFGEVAERYPVRLWLWAAENSEDGRLGDLSPEDVKDIVGHDGDPSELWDALVECGLLVEGDDGTFEIKSWDEHQGKLIQHKRRQAERVRRYRDKREAVAAPAPVKPAPTKKPQRRDDEAEFNLLWEACSKKVARGQALKTYTKLRADGEMPPVAELIVALTRLQDSEQWACEGRRFQPHLSTWLNRQGWLELPPKKATIYHGVVHTPKPYEPWRNDLTEELKAKGLIGDDSAPALALKLLNVLCDDSTNEQDARARVDAILKAEAA